jgi:hypothetical protein
MGGSRTAGGSVSVLVPVLLLANCFLVCAQVSLDVPGPEGTARVLPTDWSVLETQEPRKDLPCSVEPLKPAVGFDLRFHSGYGVTVSLRDLAGKDNLLTMIFRVTPESPKGGPSYFVQRFRVPPVEEDASGEAYLEGMFDLGEGQYHIDWLMRDRVDRLCSSYWDEDAILASKDKKLNLVLRPGAVEPTEFERFKDEPPVERARGEQPLNVKILVNFSPQDANSIAFRPVEIAGLVSILRGISREPELTGFSVVAFNLQEQRVLYRQEYADRIDFPALGQALRTMRLGTVDLKRLGNKKGETEFLANLIQQELGREDHPDALVFAGPKTLLEEDVPRDSLKEVGEVEYPVFYMNFNLHPQNVPWRDAIGRAVRFFRGYEFTISKPRDLQAAVADMVAKVVKSRSTRKTASLTSH